METILRERIAPIIIAAQNPVQRGFTPPRMNDSLLAEEVYRDVLNTRQSSELVLLDAKAAFDVVVHTHVEKTVSGRVR
jgi:hemerythrin superfamily protein